MDIDKDKFIQTYGIDDDNFITYLNKFATLKKIVNMSRLDVISKEKLSQLYNRFIYYNSLGHNLGTIVEETMPIIRNLFFFDGNGYFHYDLPFIETSGIYSNYSSVAISDRVCQLKIAFSTKTEIPSGTLLYDLLPAPFISFRISIYCDTSPNTTLVVSDEGITVGYVDIPANSEVSGEITYIIKR